MDKKKDSEIKWYELSTDSQFLYEKYGQYTVTSAKQVMTSVQFLLFFYCLSAVTGVIEMDFQEIFWMVAMIRCCGKLPKMAESLSCSDFCSNEQMCNY